MKYILTALLFFGLNLNYAQTNISLNVPTTVATLNSKFGKYYKYALCEDDDPNCYGNQYNWKNGNTKILAFVESGNGNLNDILYVIEIKSKSNLKINGITLNKSTINDCKLKFGNKFKKVDYQQASYKLFQNGFWTYFMFNKSNVLIEINLATWEKDTTG